MIEETIHVNQFDFKLGISEGKLCSLRFEKGDCFGTVSPLAQEVHKQLLEYFDGKRTVFDLPLLLQGSSFQQRVWKALMEIPYGETCSYKEIGKKIGVQKGYQAIGQAIHRNPIAIVIPCHRVLKSSGELGGYVYGVELKQVLLSLEHKKGTIDSQ